MLVNQLPIRFRLLYFEKSALKHSSGNNPFVMLQRALLTHPGW